MMTSKTFTKTQELDLLVALRNAYEYAMRGFFCNNDYHSEALKKEIDDLLVLLHKIYQSEDNTNQVEN